MGKPSKSAPRELENDWYAKPGQHRLARVKRIMSGTDTRQETYINNLPMTDNIPEPNLSTVYALDDYNKFKVIGYKCNDCGKSMSKLNIAEKHPLVCDKSIVINKEKEKLEMPVQRVVKNGETYYRWGDHGHLYKTKEEAEKQARAAYSAGYKEKK